MKHVSRCTIRRCTDGDDDDAGVEIALEEGEAFFVMFLSRERASALEKGLATIRTSKRSVDLDVWDSTATTKTNRAKRALKGSR